MKSRLTVITGLLSGAVLMLATARAIARADVSVNIGVPGFYCATESNLCTAATLLPCTAAPNLCSSATSLCAAAPSLCAVATLLYGSAIQAELASTSLGMAIIASGMIKIMTAFQIVTIVTVMVTAYQTVFRSSTEQSIPQLKILRLKPFAKLLDKLFVNP